MFGMPKSPCGTQADSAHSAVAMNTSSTSSAPFDRLPCLAELRANEEAVVVALDHNAEGCRRLCELGLAPGMCVTMLCPGRTCLLRVGKARFSLRSDELKTILVERLAGAP